MQIPLDPSLEKLTDVPYTYSYVIKKRIQIDSLNELPKEKRPPDSIIWDGTQEDIDDWLDRVFERKDKNKSNEGITLDLSNMKIEG